MAATTISRASLTDGVSVWNAALVGTAVYDKVDALIAGAVTFGGVIGSEALGTHSFVAGGTGQNIALLRNTSAGTANYAAFHLGNNSAALLAGFWGFSSTFTSDSIHFTSGATLASGGAGGLSVGAYHASGDLRFYSGGSVSVAKFGAADGCLQVNKGLWLSGSYDQTITGTQAVDSGGQFYSVIRLTSCTSTPKISAFTAGNDGDIKIVVNVSGAACAVGHNVGGIGTRIYCSNAADTTIADKESCLFIYDVGTVSWYQVGPQ